MVVRGLPRQSRQFLDQVFPVVELVCRKIEARELWEDLISPASCSSIFWSLGSVGEAPHAIVTELQLEQVRQRRRDVPDLQGSTDKLDQLRQMPE